MKLRPQISTATGSLDNPTVPENELGQEAKKGSFDEVLRSAYDLNRAIQRITSRVPHAGDVVTVWEFKEHPQPSEPECHTLEQLDAANIEANTITRSFAFGTYETEFKLKVTYPGCECEKVLSYYTHIPESTFMQWLENAPVSGFGDNRALENKVDATVRKACEIPASHFKVNPELLEDIAELWADNFLPSKVRAETYKIHIYGKGGHFKSHRDTPEASLVGTFLLGIGDYTPVSEGNRYDPSSESVEQTDAGHFCIGGFRRTARKGEWVAFHPDVPHSVEPLESGSRAVIAFKIFSLEADVASTRSEASRRYPAVVETTKAALGNIKGSFGIILQHKYPMGTKPESLVGSDAVLLSAAKQVPGTKTVEVIPILVDIHEKRGYRSEGFESTISAKVYPFTGFHVDIALNRRVDPEIEASMSWIKSATDIPFYSWDFKQKAMKWSSHEEEINYTGNESDGLRETSLYLAYAIVVVSAAGAT